MISRFKEDVSPGIGYIVSKSNRHVKRLFKNNMQSFKIKSEKLNKVIRLRCTCKFFKNILRYGSLDRYLISNKKRKLLSPFRELKIKIHKKDNIKKEV